LNFANIELRCAELPELQYTSRQDVGLQDIAFVDHGREEPIDVRVH